jgi:SAM-dependent methyltransferase
MAIRDVSASVPWVRMEGARYALREAAARADRPGDDYDSLREALAGALRTLAPERQVASAFEWILGHIPDSQALAFHIREMARQHDGLEWLLHLLLLEGHEAPPASPPADALDRLRARNGTSRESGPSRTDESFAGEHGLARTLLLQADGFDGPAFVDLAFERVLGRPVDDAARRFYASKLSKGEMNRPHLLRELLWSEELRRPAPRGSGSDTPDGSCVDSSSTEAMARAWDARAEDNAYFYIASGASTSDEEFRRSGERELEEVVLDAVDLAPSAEALEIGCGIGRMLVPLADRVRVAHGVDVSKAMIARSREFCAGKPNIRTSLTDGTLRAFADSSIDFVFSYIVFQHVPDEGAIARYVREAARVLRPGGLLRFQVDGRWMLGRPRDTYDGVKLSGPAVRRMVRDAGLLLGGEWGEDTHYYWIDARSGEDAAGSPVRLLSRAFDTGLLTRLLARCGLESARRLADEVSGGARSLRSVMTAPFARLPAAPNDFVHESFRLLLDREPRADEEVFHVRALESGWADRDAILDSLVTCGPFRDLVQPSRRQRDFNSFERR